MLEHRETLRTEGNVADVSILCGHQAILYSMDNLHAPNSTTVVESKGQRPMLGSYSYSNSLDKWGRESDMEIIAASINNWAAEQESFSSNLNSQSALVSDLLYSIDKLRKRGQDDG